MTTLLTRLRRGTTSGVEGDVGEATMGMDVGETADVGVDWLVSSTALFA